MKLHRHYSRDPIRMTNFSLTKFTDMFARQARAAVGNVEETQKERARNVIGDALHPPRYSAVWFTRRTDQWNAHRLQSYRMTCITNISNSLPDHVVEADSINSFKSRLDQYWTNQDVICNYDCDLTGTGGLRVCM